MLEMKELGKSNGQEINRMMEFLAEQSAEHKKYKEKESRQTEASRRQDTHSLRKNMTDCFPKHPKVFGKRVKKQELFESPKFMP